MSLNVIAPINSLGYGNVSTNLIHELIINNYSPALFPINGRVECDTYYNNSISKAIENSKLFDYEASSLKIWHQNQLGDSVGRGPRLGFPIFELNQFTEVEKHHLNYQDVLLTPTEWAKNILESNFPSKKVHKVNFGVNRDFFNEKVERPAKLPELLQNKDNSTIFFNIGKWEIRKGHDILVDMFNGAFTSKDKVKLWLLCENPFLTPEEDKEWKDLYRNSPLGDKIVFIPRVQTQRDIALIMNLGDVGVFPARAEGWNLEALECMSCGKQCIITDYAGHTEYANEYNATLIKIEENEPAYDGKWFYGQGEWGVIGDNQIDQGITAMRYYHEQKQKGGLDINKEGIETAKMFSWFNSLNQLVASI